MTVSNLKYKNDKLTVHSSSNSDMDKFNATLARSFTKTWAPGKLTGCEGDFICLV